VILDQTPLAPDLQKTVKPPRVRFNPVVLILDAPCGLERSLQLWPARKRIAFGALNLNEAGDDVEALGRAQWEGVGSSPPRQCDSAHYPSDDAFLFLGF
jgi:hypothetical protein